MSRDIWILALVVFAAGLGLGVVFSMVADRQHNRDLLTQKAKLKKSLSKCRTVMASQDSQVATDLMKLTAQVNDVAKRVKVMASLLQRDAEVMAEVRWFIQLSKRLEQQGMVGCTYRRNKRGKLRKCLPKFNISDCKKVRGYWSCPIPEPPVVKRKRKKRRKR
jgi:uncharacterized membrane-anchored protein YhcB (DUF1043 family)